VSEAVKRLSIIWIAESRSRFSSALRRGPGRGGKAFEAAGGSRMLYRVE